MIMETNMIRFKRIRRMKNYIFTKIMMMVKERKLSMMKHKCVKRSLWDEFYQLFCYYFWKKNQTYLRKVRKKYWFYIGFQTDSQGFNCGSKLF